MNVYRKRRAIVEHPFGVIKRQWDFYSIMTKKSMKHASADVELIFTCYNLRLVFNWQKSAQRVHERSCFHVFDFNRVF
jgi:hypothetical protein